MKNSWKIFVNDLNNIRSNILTVIVLCGLIFLPSLYAWFNISASWDPYSQTDQLPVGVVNEDTGVHMRDEQIHVGDEVVAALKENAALDWQFLDEESAMNQLNKGHLFAVIVISEDFSKHLGTVIEKNPQKAVIEYYVNEKINAIAPKITEKGASVIVENITKQFITTINDIVFSFFNEVGLELEDELPDIEKLGQYVFTLEERLPGIEMTLEDSLQDAKRANVLLAKAEAELPSVENIVNRGIRTIDRVIALLNDIETSIHHVEETVEDGRHKATKDLQQLNDYLINAKENHDDLSVGIANIEDLQDEIATSLSAIEGVIETLESLLETSEVAELPTEQKQSLESMIAELTHIKSLLVEGDEQAREIIATIESYEQDVERVLTMVESTSETVTAQLDQIIETFTDSIVPTAEQEITTARITLQNAHTVLTDVQNHLPEVTQMLKRTQDNLQAGESSLEEILAEYPFIYEKTVYLADNIRDFQEEMNLYEIVDLLQSEPNSEKGFLAEPVLLKENKLFPIENYGSGMTPFYTLLSLWVGGILLISVIATNVLNPGKYAQHEIYFGKLYLFLSIGCLQTLIVTLGDVFILKVPIAHTVWFVVFGILCSIVFMTLVYTFASLFGDVGKALAIIMLVLQLAGSGGTYPVALLPKFFQTISPFLPFTYAVGLMREAVGGIVWSNALINISVLIGIALLGIVLGAVLKRPLNELSSKFKGESEDGGIFH